MLGGVSVSVSLEITDIIHICYCTMVIDVYYNCSQKEKIVLRLKNQHIIKYSKLCNVRVHLKCFAV